jgi:hypothetical protein
VCYVVCYVVSTRPCGEYPLPARRGTNNEGDQLLTEGKRKFRAALTKRLADVVCPLHLVALYFLPITPRTDVKKEVEDAVERALVKINPSVEWEAFVNAGLPAASADEECTWDDVKKFLAVVLKDHHELRKTVLAVYGAAPSEASVERAFSLMKNVVRPVRHHLRANVVRNLMVVASCNRLIASVAADGEAKALAAGMQPAATPPERAKQQRGLRLLARSRDQNTFSSFATKVSRSTVSLLFGFYCDHPRRVNTAASGAYSDKLRPGHAFSKVCQCTKKLTDHEQKPFIICSSKTACRTLPNCINYVCANHPKHRVAEVDQQKLVVVDSVSRLQPTWVCQRCTQRAAGTQ